MHDCSININIDKDMINLSVATTLNKHNLTDKMLVMCYRSRRVNMTLSSTVWSGNSIHDCSIDIDIDEDMINWSVATTLKQTQFDR